MMIEQCNTGRQLNVDVAKCYEIVAMILVHSLVFLGVDVELKVVQSAAGFLGKQMEE